MPNDKKNNIIIKKKKNFGCFILKQQEYHTVYIDLQGLSVCVDIKINYFCDGKDIMGLVLL